MFPSKLPYTRCLENIFSKYWSKVTIQLCTKTSEFRHKKLCDFDSQKILPATQEIDSENIIHIVKITPSNTESIWYFT